MQINKETTTPKQQEQQHEQLQKHQQRPATLCPTRSTRSNDTVRLQGLTRAKQLNGHFGNMTRQQQQPSKGSKSGNMMRHDAI